MRTITSAQVSDKVIMARSGTMEWERKHYFSIERYRLLSTRVMRVAHNMRTQVFLMASAIAEEGKTLTSANLAYAMSSAEGKRTLLLELDLRRPSLRTLLGAQADPGEALFLEADDWRSHLWELRPNLHALIAMRGAERPDEILHGEAVRRLIDEARREYDYVLIDSAPLLLAVDTHVLLPHADHALLMVRADATPIACTQDALKALGDKALGCILNDVKRLKYEEYYRSYYR
ncbi:MAG TPA: CpsD/CapB family tyrosine-protein kinase [Acidobacteriaceae bacterium]